MRVRLVARRVYLVLAGPFFGRVTFWLFPQNSYFTGNTCAEIKTLATANNITVLSCSNLALAAPPKGIPNKAHVLTLLGGATFSGPYIKIGTIPPADANPARIVYFFEFDGQFQTHVAQMATNNQVLDAQTPLPAIPIIGELYGMSMVSTGQVAYLPLQDPDPLGTPTVAAITLTYASLGSNLTAIVSQEVAVDFANLTFTPLSPAVTIDDFYVANGIPHLSFQSVSNQTYSLARRDDLLGGQWTPVSGQTNILGNGQLIQVTDPSVNLTNSSKRFYTVSPNL